MKTETKKYSDMLEFYKGKKVLVTGHTGFKGTWLTKILLYAGAQVCGYSLNPPTDPNLYTLSKVEKDEKMTSIIGDIRDYDRLKKAIEEFQPEIVFHLAAQPIVRDSYIDPMYTYSTNVMGTVNILECIRTAAGIKSFLNVTTDKVYQNKEWNWGYRENDPLDGYDPYSNSKSCSELVTHSYLKSFFSDGSIAISTARAGNVIGGGDFAHDRIIPDSVRAMEKAYLDKQDKGVIGVRNPYSTRPYQHVLEPLFVYLTIAYKQYNDISYADNYNVGPDDCDCVTTGELVDMFVDKWNKSDKQNIEWPRAEWENQAELGAPHEANFLKLDCSKLKSKIQWRPRWHIEECIDKTVSFSKKYLEAPDTIPQEMETEIEDFCEIHN